MCVAYDVCVCVLMVCVCLWCVCVCVLMVCVCAMVCEYLVKVWPDAMVVCTNPYQGGKILMKLQFILRACSKPFLLKPCLVLTRVKQNITDAWRVVQTTQNGV